MHGWALSGQEQSAQGIAQIRDGLATLERAGDRLIRLYYLTLLAKALAKGGQRDEGLTAIDEAIEAAGRPGCPTGIRSCSASVASCFWPKARSEAVAVETCFRQAIEIAQIQSAKSLELRAATSLARQWRDQVRRAQAHDLLAPVDSWFTEGFDTADLKEAKELLGELR